MSFSIRNGDLYVGIYLGAKKVDISGVFALESLEIHESILNPEYLIPKILVSLTTKTQIDFESFYETQVVTVSIKNNQNKSEPMKIMTTLIYDVDSESINDETTRLSLVLVPEYYSSLLNSDTLNIKATIPQVLSTVCSKLDLSVDIKLLGDVVNSYQLWTQSNIQNLEFLNYLINRLGSFNNTTFRAFDFIGLKLRDTLSILQSNSFKRLVSTKIKDSDIPVKDSSTVTFLDRTFKYSYGMILTLNDIANNRVTSVFEPENSSIVLNQSQYILKENIKRENSRYNTYVLEDSNSLFKNYTSIQLSNKLKFEDFNVGLKSVLSDSEYQGDLHLLDAVNFIDTKFYSPKNKQTSGVYVIADIITKFISNDFVQSVRLITNSLNNID